MLPFDSNIDIDTKKQTYPQSTIHENTLSVRKYSEFLFERPSG